MLSCFAFGLQEFETFIDFTDEMLKGQNPGVPQDPHEPPIIRVIRANVKDVAEDVRA